MVVSRLGVCRTTKMSTACMRMHSEVSRDRHAGRVVTCAFLTWVFDVAAATSCFFAAAPFPSPAAAWAPRYSLRQARAVGRRTQRVSYIWAKPCSSQILFGGSSLSPSRKHRRNWHGCAKQGALPSAIVRSRTHRHQVIVLVEPENTSGVPEQYTDTGPNFDNATVARLHAVARAIRTANGIETGQPFAILASCLN
jgi:hypothetical protein